MTGSKIVVEVVADEIAGHLPVWFPAPIFDDATRMPISPGLEQAFRTWNSVGADQIDTSAAAIDEHYRVGLGLAYTLAEELGSDYSVRMLMAGSRPGWRTL